MVTDTSSPHDGHGGHDVGHGHQASAPQALPTGYAAFLAEMHEGMEVMWRDMHGSPASGNADVDFLRMMMPHHAGAIAMARLLLRYGSDPVVRSQAEAMIGTQASEIQGMKGRLAVLLAGSAQEGEFPSPSGNAGAANR